MQCTGLRPGWGRHSSASRQTHDMLRSSSSVFVVHNEPIEQGPALAKMADPHSEGRTRECVKGVDHDDIHG